MIKLSYEMIWHALGGADVKEPVTSLSDTPYDIDTMELPVWVDHIEILSPQPLEYKLRHRPAPNAPLPEQFQTLYFRNADVLTLGRLMDESGEDADRMEAIHKIVMTGLAHDYYFAGGISDDELSDDTFLQTPVIISADRGIYAFKANCILLQKAYHPPQNDPTPNRIWERINATRYALGGYRTS